MLNSLWRWRGRSQPVSLALQGGGAHGAFTWGVLDVLLERTSHPIAGISGSSAGAVNAVVLAHGWLKAGATVRARRWPFWEALGKRAMGRTRPDGPRRRAAGARGRRA